MTADGPPPLPTPAEAGDNGDNGGNGNGNGNEAPPLGEQPPSEHITIKFSNQRGDDVQFKMKPMTKLGKAMSAFAERSGQNRKALRFIFEGERVLDHHTPQDFEMGEGDQIDVHEEQIGGGLS